MMSNGQSPNRNEALVGERMMWTSSKSTSNVEQWGLRLLRMTLIGERLSLFGSAYPSLIPSYRREHTETQRQDAH